MRTTSLTNGETAMEFERRRPGEIMAGVRDGEKLEVAVSPATDKRSFTRGGRSGSSADDACRRSSADS